MLFAVGSGHDIRAPRGDILALLPFPGLEPKPTTAPQHREISIE